MMRFSLDLLVLIFICPTFVGAVALDTGVLADWTAGSLYPCRPPFKATYSKNGKSVMFLATSHVFGSTVESDPRLALLRKEIETFKPGGIVIERPVSPGDFSGSKLEAEIKKGGYGTGKFEGGEPTYLGITAARNGATVVGGEKYSDEGYV